MTALKWYCTMAEKYIWEEGKVKKILSVLLLLCLIVPAGMAGSVKPAEAASLETDHGFQIDLDLFDINWKETNKIVVKQDVRSLDSKFDKGVKLGHYKVAIGFATSYKAVNGKIYQRILARGEMVPYTVKNNKKAMSQLLEIRVDHSGYQTIQELGIEPASTSGTTSYSTTGTLGLSLGGAVSISAKGELGFSRNGALSMGISRSVNFATSSLIVTTNKDDQGIAWWEYDYVSSNKNKTQNAYLFGSSEQYGVFSWNMPNAKGLVGKMKVTVTAKFGGGDTSDASVAKSWTGSRILGTDSYSFWVTMYDANTNYVGK